MTCLRYNEDIETDEQATIDGIIQGKTEQSKSVENREGHVVHASHARNTACVIVEMTVVDDLPPEQTTEDGECQSASEWQLVRLSPRAGSGRVSP